MNELRTVSLATYYTTKSQTPGEDAGTIRDWMYLCKDNRDGVYVPTTVNHPRHPKGQATRLSNPQQAYAYAAESFVAVQGKICEHFGIDSVANAHLVPVPSSVAVLGCASNIRWPALRLAQALAAMGFGRVHRALHLKAAVHPKSTTGTVRTFSDILGNLHVSSPQAGPLFLVDDLVTHGTTLAACADALEDVPPTGALTLATTDSRPQNAYIPRARKVIWDPSSGWVFVADDNRAGD